MKSPRSYVVDFLTLNHDDDLLEMVKAEWRAEAIATTKIDLIEIAADGCIKAAPAKVIAAERTQMPSALAR